MYEKKRLLTVDSEIERRLLRVFKKIMEDMNNRVIYKC